MTRFSITTPIFYVNAPPHVGHAYTVVAADVLARFARQRGADVFFLTGTDEHGTKIAEAAAAAGTAPQAFVDEIAQTFRDAWRALNIEAGDFLRTTEPRHEAGVRQALQVLHDKGLLREQSYRGRYCTGCEKFVTEKDLDGAGKCPFHGTAPTEVEEKNWFFALSKFLPRVRQAIETEEIRILPAARRNEVLGLFAQGLDDLSVSRSRERASWGIPLPFDQTQTVYVWVDALLNYITALGYGSDPHAPWPKADGPSSFWPADIQLIGQDILKFHAVYWPALLLALDLPLPRSLVVHGFFTVDGQKISKSLGNVLDPRELVRTYGADATRYLLLSPLPFGNSGDVSSEGFRTAYEADLANTFGNLVSRTLTLVTKHCDARVPAADIDPTVEEKLRVVYEALAAHARDHRWDALVHALCRAVPDLGQFLNAFLDHAAPWAEANVARRPRVLRSVLEGIFHLAGIVAPVLPVTAEKVRVALGASALPADVRARLVGGSPVTKPEILFPK